MSFEEQYMSLCLSLAQEGNGMVAPNPMVGAVLVHDNEIIGIGWHKMYGKEHAEVHAIRSVKDVSLLAQSTLYISLEPCSHIGKTPPCTDLIIQNKIPKVVVGCVDSSKKVAGKGIEKLRKAGVEVQVGVLNDQCREINERFFTFHEQQRPYVILKWAQSPDGFMDIERQEKQKGVFWITDPDTKSLVHQWRSHEMAVLIGKQTALNDNPQLTVRHVHGRNPIRVLLDSQLSVPLDAAIFSPDSPTIVLNTLVSENVQGIQRIKIEEMTPSTILSCLYQQGIQSVFIEGGKRVLNSFLESNLWDEIRVLVGTNPLKRGLQAPKWPSSIGDEKYTFGPDTVIIFKKNK